jgi:hypothetical protein
VKRMGSTPLAFHGIVIRSRDPKALARRLRAVLGWRVLRETAREIVLGDGPELFVTIRRAALRRAGRDAVEGVEEIHLAVKDIRRARRKTEEDALGGDSFSAEVAPGLTLAVRELKRAATKSWVKRR